MEFSPSYSAMRREPPPEHFEAVRRIREMLVPLSNGPYIRPVKGESGGMNALTKTGTFRKDTLVKETTSKLEHIKEACSTQFPSQASRGDNVIRSDLRAAVAYNLSRGKYINSWRVQQEKSLAGIATYLAKVNDEIHLSACAPSTVTALNGKFNIAMLCAVSDAFEWPDHGLPNALLHGMEVIGDIPDSGVFRVIEPTIDSEKFAVSYERVMSTNDGWTDNLCNLLKKKVSKMDRESLEYKELVTLEQITEREVTKNLLGKSMTRKEVEKKYGVGKFRAMLRFGVLQNGKIRPVDDGKSSGHNGATRMSETVYLPTFEYPARVAAEVVAQCVALSKPVPEMGVGLDDMASAYRKVPTSQPQFTLIAIWSTTHESVRFHEVFGHNFGLLSAVTNFSRVPAILVAVARRLFAVMVENYIDDYMIPDFIFSKGSAQSSLGFVHNLFGFPLAPEKRKLVASSNIILGMICDMSRVSSERVVIFQPRGEKLEEALEIMRSCRRKDCLDNKSAEICAGKLNFLLSATYGRVGRAATLPLVQRINGGSKGHPNFTKAEHSMVEFFEALLPNLKPRVVNLGGEEKGPVVVYSDASSDGKKHKLGIVIFDTNAPLSPPMFASSPPPSWALKILKAEYVYEEGEEKVHLICPLELLAAIAVGSTFPDVVKGRRVMLFIDNTAALSSVVYGYTSRPAMALLSNIFHLQSSELGMDFWGEWVPSEANIADVPSREGSSDEWRLLEVLGAVRHEMRFPPKEFWEDLTLMVPR